MKIIYDQNPLKTVVDISDDDIAKNLLMTAIENDELESILISALVDFREGKDHHAKNTILNWYDKSEKFERRVAQMYAMAIEGLKDYHCGDCTCVPASCEKCYAEEKLGINTMPGLGKHEAHYIESAFKNGKTLDNAIEWLKQHVPHHDDPSYKEHVKRWKKEKEAAYIWLKEYKEQHFADK